MYAHKFKSELVVITRRGELRIAKVAADFSAVGESVRRWIEQTGLEVEIRND